MGKRIWKIEIIDTMFMNGLIKKTGEVFYVWKGCNNRYLQKSVRNQFFIDYCNTHECDVRKVFINLTEEKAFEKEIELIAY